MAELRLLGPVEFVLDGRVVDLGPSKQRTVLAALLIDVGRPVATEALIDRVWGADPPPSARSSLYSYITRLRHVLADAGRHDAGPRRLVHRAGAYLLHLPAEEVDVHHLRQSLRQARGEPDDQRRADWLAKAVSLRRGQPLAGLPGDWAAQTRATLAHEHLDATLLWAQAELRLGRTDAVVGPLRALSVEFPWVEPLAAALMEALYRGGRTAEALDCYAATRRRLVSELGVEPGPVLRRHHAAILRGGPLDESGEPPAAPRVQPQSTADALGPPEPQVPLPSQVPLDALGFTGRRDELSRLDGLLAASRAQPTAVVVVALTGSAGVGKSALAVHWAHRRAGDFPDGQLYANLRGFGPSGEAMQPAEAVRDFLDAMGVPAAQIPVGFEAQVSLYRSVLAGRRMLVLLDNAATAEQVRPLLPASAGCLVIVTSRNALTGLVVNDGAHPLMVDVLRADDAVRLLSQRIGTSRAHNEPHAVQDIVDRCANLPLALALVAARAAARPQFPLEVFAAEIRAANDRLDPWARTDPTVDLRSIFSWSYRTLSERAAVVFRLLGLHRGPDFDPAAVARLAGLTVKEILLPLEELATAHLLIEYRPRRYTCHDLLRAYAAELVHDNETEAERRLAAGRLLDHYLALAYAAAQRANPTRPPIPTDRPPAPPEDVWFADRDTAMSWFGMERAVLIGCVRYATAHGFDTHAWQLAWALTNYLDVTGHWADWEQTHLCWVSAARRLGDRAVQGWAYRALGMLYTRTGRHPEAELELLRALELFREENLLVGQANTYLNLVWISDRAGAVEVSLDRAQRALALYRQAGDAIGIARGLNTVGWCLAALDQPRRAIECCQEALAGFQALGDLPEQASTLDSLGLAYARLGEYDDAGYHYQAAIKLQQLTDDPYNEAGTRTRLGEALLAAGDAEGAQRCWHTALTILERLEHPDAEPLRARLAGAVHES